MHTTALPPPDAARLAVLFHHLLAAMDGLIDAERDMIGLPGHDPAVDAWFTAAERARDTVLGLIATGLDAPSAAPDDVSLRHVLRLFRRVMLSDDPADVEQLRLQASAMTEQCLAHGVCGADCAVNRLVLQGLDRFEAYLMLEESGADLPAPDTIAQVEELAPAA